MQTSVDEPMTYFDAVFCALTMRGEVLTTTTGTPLPRGTYVCTLVTDGRVADTKKMQVK